MKAIITSIALLISFAASAQGSGIKLYIGAAETEEKQKSRYFLQLVVCNNMSDTAYIERDDLDNIFARITTDASEINDGDHFYLINNVHEIITDQQELLTLSGKNPPVEQFNETIIRQRKDFEDNNKLPQKEVNGNKYYTVAPGKCVTIKALTQTLPLEFLKLHKVSNQAFGKADVYLALPIHYFTHRDSTKRSTLLISRASEDLKKCIGAGAKKGE